MKLLKKLYTKWIQHLCVHFWEPVMILADRTAWHCCRCGKDRVDYRA